jgi:hypothetical protein
MLNPHSRRTIGKCAADLFDAGNCHESLTILRQLAQASEQQDQDGNPPAGWLEKICEGYRAERKLGPAYVR